MTITKTEFPFANLHMYTDVVPYEVVRVISDKTIEIREMDAQLAEGQRPDILPGGFAGHCVNQRELKYDITSNPNNPVIRARRRVDGYFHSAYGRHMLNDRAVRFYDYNF